MSDQTRDEQEADVSGFAPVWLEICERWGFDSFEMKDRMRWEASQVFRKGVEHERARASRPESQGREWIIARNIDTKELVALPGDYKFSPDSPYDITHRVREVPQPPASEQDYSTPDNAAMSGVPIDDRSQASDEAFEKELREHALEQSPSIFVNGEEDDFDQLVWGNIKRDAYFGRDYGRREAAAEIERLDEENVQLRFKLGDLNRNAEMYEATMIRTRDQIAKLEAELAELKK